MFLMLSTVFWGFLKNNLKKNVDRVPCGVLQCLYLSADGSIFRAKYTTEAPESVNSTQGGNIKEAPR